MRDAGGLAAAAEGNETHAPAPLAAPEARPSEKGGKAQRLPPNEAARHNTPMPDYRRARVPGGSYFFTVNLLERNSRLLVMHIDTLREAVRQVRSQRPFRIDAWVVLPDHIHAVWTLPPNDTDYSGRWRAIKIAFAKALPNTECLSAVRARKGERGIWQRRFWEHTLRDDRDYAAHIDYAHFNPVKHGLVARVQDWPYSSFQRFVMRGVYPGNWVGGDAGDLAAGERDA